jgi:periplasmic protein TonB
MVNNIKNIKLRFLLLALFLLGPLSTLLAEEPLKSGVFDPLPFFDNAIRIQGLKPNYPIRAKRFSICGEIKYALSISADGDVLDKKLIYSQPAGIFEAEVDKVIFTWKFEKKLVGDKAIAYQTVAPAKFILMDEESCPKSYSEQLLKQVRQ